MFKLSKFRKFLFFLLPILVILLYVGWEKWTASVPQPLPHQSTIASAPVLLNGSYYETSVPLPRNAKYRSADYRLWVPNNAPSIRGLIVKQHGCSDEAATTGLDQANDLQWQALAVKHQFALLGPRLLVGKGGDCDDWGYIDRGSEASFLSAIATLAQQSHHPELTQVPWALWGHSGGSDWSVQMLQKYPDRTLAVVAVRCGASTVPETPNSAIASVPLLFAVAQKENTLVNECRDLPKRIFQTYRKIGALWAIAEEANAHHEVGDTRLLAIPYFDAIITARLSEAGAIRPLNLKQGWLSNPATRAVAPVEQYQGNSLEAAWLPNAETAHRWQDYVTTGRILPTQKPIAPTTISAIATGSSEVLLTWQYTPDLNNGLPFFHIYRNHTLIKTFKGQPHNFGDAPESPKVALEFRDTGAAANSTYTVAAFNDLGESSQPPQPIIRR